MVKLTLSIPTSVPSKLLFTPCSLISDKVAIKAWEVRGEDGAKAEKRCWEMKPFQPAVGKCEVDPDTFVPQHNPSWYRLRQRCT